MEKIVKKEHKKIENELLTLDRFLFLLRYDSELKMEIKKIIREEVLKEIRIQRGLLKEWI